MSNYFLCLTFEEQKAKTSHPTALHKKTSVWKCYLIRFNHFCPFIFF